MREIRESMAQVLKRNGFDKESNTPSEPALTEDEHIEELCLVSSYLSETLAYYVAKNGLKPDAMGVKTSSVPDKS